MKLATEGFPVSYSLGCSRCTARNETKLLSQFPESKRIFLECAAMATNWCSPNWPRR